MPFVEGDAFSTRASLQINGFNTLHRVLVTLCHVGARAKAILTPLVHQTPKRSLWMGSN